MEKHIIFLYPLHPVLQELKDALEAEGGYDINEIDSVGEYKQLVPVIGQCVTFTSDIKKISQSIESQVTLVKDGSSKIIIMGKNLNTQEAGQLMGLGIKEILPETTNQKALRFKLNLFLKGFEAAEAQKEKERLAEEKKNKKNEKKKSLELVPDSALEKKKAYVPLRVGEVDLELDSAANEFKREETEQEAKKKPYIPFRVGEEVEVQDNNEDEADNEENKPTQKKPYKPFRVSEEIDDESAPYAKSAEDKKSQGLKGFKSSKLTDDIPGDSKATSLDEEAEKKRKRYQQLLLQREEILNAKEEERKKKQHARDLQLKNAQSEKDLELSEKIEKEGPKKDIYLKAQDFTDLELEDNDENSATAKDIYLRGEAVSDIYLRDSSSNSLPRFYYPPQGVSFYMPLIVELLQKKPWSQDDYIQFICFLFQKTFRGHLTFFIEKLPSTTDVVGSTYLIDNKSWKFNNTYSPGELFLLKELNVPTWSDYTFKNLEQEFFFPFFHKEQRLGFAHVSFLHSPILNETDASEVELLLMMATTAYLKAFGREE